MTSFSNFVNQAFINSFNNIPQILISSGKVNDKYGTPVFPNATREIHSIPNVRKFYEIVDLNNGLSNYLICIGLNPKYIDDNKMDDSNIKLCQYCDANGYAGYLLLNLFSYRTDNKDILENYLANRPSIDTMDNMQRFIRKIIKNSKLNILLFYGKWNICFVDNNLSFELSQVIQQRIFFTADSNMNFVHIGSQYFSSVKPISNAKAPIY